MEALIFEAQQRVKWYISGIGLHGLTPDLFFNLSTDRLCELYNIELEFFNP